MTKIAEYLALGKPVVAFELLETRRTARHAALLVPPGDVVAFADAIRRLARDPVLRKALATGCTPPRRPADVGSVRASAVRSLPSTQRQQPLRRLAPPPRTFPIKSVSWHAPAPLYPT